MGKHYCHMHHAFATLDGGYGWSPLSCESLELRLYVWFTSGGEERL